MLGKKIMAVAVLVGIFDFSTPGISAAEGFVESILLGKPIINLRYRFEHVDQEGLPEDANASTLRSRLGYETQAYNDFYVLIELENVFSIGKERFNDTINGKTDFPIVADPETTELNQGFFNFDGLPDTSLRFGRQRIVLDNQRFVGAVAFRQNEQTFDAVSMMNQSLPDVSVRYAYIFNVNRIFGDDSPVGDFDANTHLVNISYDGLPWSTLTGYAYLVELEDAQTLSSQSYGLRLSGSHRFRFNRDLGVAYAAEFAHQRDYGGNPGDFEANYYLLEPSISIDDLTIRFGYEVLDGDGIHSFQTPLATLHAFNGVTDKFLTTPADGLEDLYLKFQYVMEGLGPSEQIKLSTAYHDFSSEESNRDLGWEWGVKVAVKINRFLALSLEFADYNADSFGTDTEKLWATVQVIY